MEKSIDLTLRINKSVDKIKEKNNEIIDDIDSFGDEISDYVNSDEEVEDIDDTLKQSFKTTILNAIKEKFNKYI